MVARARHYLTLVETTINPLDHLGLVRAIANRYASKVSEPFEDLFQEGFIGLLTASRKYDPGKGLAFTTFAYYRIDAAIGRYLSTKTRNVHLREDVARQLRKEDALPVEEGTEAISDLACDGDPASDAAEKEERERIRAVLGSLAPDDRRVVEMRFSDEMTLEQIGDAFGVTREAIRQRLEGIFRTLRIRLGQALS